MFSSKDCRSEVKINVSIYGENRQSGDLQTIYRALQQVPEIKVTCASDIPPQCISIGGKVLAVVDDFDAWDSLMPERGGEFLEWVHSLRPAIIFKLQYRRGADYPAGTVSAGYLCHPLSYDVTMPPDLGSRARSVDVTARMRTGGYESPETDWMRQRAEIVSQTRRLADEGLNVIYGKISPEGYHAELPNAQIGFVWRGFGMLCYRLLEYLRAGVIPITEPLGAEWPLREDVILEDDVHCVHCDDPKRFAEAARLLLRDRRKMKRIRGNILDLWRERLCLAAMGRWYWNELNRQARQAAHPPAD
jgi:hypothetical protein